MCLMKCRVASQEPYVAFAAIETRDWSVQGQKAHEHFVTLEVKTKSRSRRLAQDIVGEIETAFDNADLTLPDHALVNLRLTFWTVAKSNEVFRRRGEIPRRHRGDIDDRPKRPRPPVET